MCACGGICQTSQSQWLCKVLYCASPPVVNCSTVLTWFVTSCLKRVFYDCVLASWTLRCLQVTLNLSLNFFFYSLQLYLSLSLMVGLFWFNAWPDMMHPSTVHVHHLSSSYSCDLSTPMTWTKPLPGDTCQALRNACNNSSIGNHNNNCQRHI